MMKNDISGNPEIVGIRFFVFRKAIKRTLPQLARELGMETARAADIENGREWPEIEELYYLSLNYALNINWMLGREDNMFVETGRIPNELNSDYIPKTPVKDGESSTESTAELLSMMQVPAIEKTVFETLKRIVEKLSEKLV
jgi:transcriptional regulator with XRE-family HTH domain